MEITDRIGHKGVWNEIYDFNIHYDRELRLGFLSNKTKSLISLYWILKSKISLSTYFFSAKGTANPFGETDLKQVFDFNSQERTKDFFVRKSPTDWFLAFQSRSHEKLVFTIDQVRGNCSIHSINPDWGDYPASSVWPHPDGSISMHGAEYFWHIPNHARDQYYYKGNLTKLNQDVVFMLRCIYDTKYTSWKMDLPRRQFTPSRSGFQKQI